MQISQGLLAAVPLHAQVAGVGTVEERLTQAMLIALAVREVYVTSRSLWRAGRKWFWRWRRARRSNAQPSDPELVALARRMFPDPPAVDAYSWAEVAALAGIKYSVRGLFNLLPESTCAAVYRSVRWPLGQRCIYCGGENLRVKDPSYRQYWQRYTCLDCTAEKGKVYLPLYVARFEFTFNRRDQRRWGQLIDLLALGRGADGRHLRLLVREGRLREACLIPGLPMD